VYVAETTTDVYSVFQFLFSSFFFFFFSFPYVIYPPHFLYVSICIVYHTCCPSATIVLSCPKTLLVMPEHRTTVPLLTRILRMRLIQVLAASAYECGASRGHGVPWGASSIAPLLGTGALLPRVASARLAMAATTAP
jgi:hypothetical protein